MTNLPVTNGIPLPQLEKLQKATLVCPLCSAPVSVRGLRPRPDPGLPLEHWDVIFTCSACGLLTTFDSQHFSARLLNAIPGTQWAAQLRRYYQRAPVEKVAHEQQATGYHFFSVFVISFLTWIVLTSSLNLIDLVWGGAASLIVAWFSYRLFAFELPRWITSPRRWLAFLALLVELARQLIKQNISLSLRVLKPTLRIQPGIVAVPTKLRDDVALTLLGSLMTLTPDTVTIDIDQKNGIFYMHWIDVQASDPEEIYALIAADFEERLIRWLQ
jgi:multicomponent Na+:H+ antiporter subunit E